MISLLNKQGNILAIGEIVFLQGVLFLPFAFPIGAFFLLISLIISLITNRNQIFKDNWNYPLFMSIGIILLSTINATSRETSFELLNYEKSIIWINLFNWIPILIGFFAFQTYLKSIKQKINFSKFLLIGTIPVIISCILQFNFNIYGPFSIFNGLIVWFQYPLEESASAVTGLFSNQNYTACYLSTVLPFSLLALKLVKRNLNKCILFIYNLLIVYFLFLTYSRNAFICLFIISLCFFGIKRFLLIISSLSIISLFLGSISIVNSHILSFFSSINLSTFNSIKASLTTAPRIQIWDSSISLIFKKPILGWGASTFSHLFNFHNNKVRIPIKSFDSQHSHNLFLELAHNFGLPLALIILITLIFLVFKVKREINTVNKAPEYSICNTWLLASLLILLCQTTDITYYDGKISLLICILFAGLRTILPSSNSKKKHILS